MLNQVTALRKNELRGYADIDHLKAAAAWLARAQDASSDGGVSGRFFLKSGWTSSYPETTGYIVPTFLALARELDPTFHSRAERCVAFLLGVQLEEGAFPGGELAENRTRASVFNTAQIINGLVAWHSATGDQAAADAATRAADWLVAQQDEDGAWRKHIYGSVTSYTSHASCWLAEAGHHFSNERWLRSAERHLDWVLTNVDPQTGWIERSGFGDHEQRSAVTHTLAYTIWGVLHLSQILRRDDGFTVARHAAEQVMRRLELAGWLPGEIDYRWKAARADYACLTGNAQMALIWLRLAEITGDLRFVNAALKAIDLVSAAHPLENSDPGIRGGVAGSAPIWGPYIQMGFPNWAAKFYIDALLAKKATLARLPSRRVEGGKSTTGVRTNEVVSGRDHTDSAKGTSRIRVVLLTSPMSHKVPQMVTAWRDWGFLPDTVVIEHHNEPSLAERVRARARDDGVGRTIAKSLRRRSHRAAAQARSESPPQDVRQFCATHSIPIVDVGQLSEADSVAAVAALSPDIMVHAGAGILRRNLLATARLGTLNAHMGILPHFRGMNVAEWARFERKPVGCTVHLVDPGIDTGDILATRVVNTASARSIESLRALVDVQQIDLLGAVLRAIIHTGVVPQRTPQSVSDGQQYYRMHPALKAVLEQELQQPAGHP